MNQGPNYSFNPNPNDPGMNPPNQYPPNQPETGPRPNYPPYGPYDATLPPYRPDPNFNQWAPPPPTPAPVYAPPPRQRRSTARVLLLVIITLLLIAALVAGVFFGVVIPYQNTQAANAHATATAQARSAATAQANAFATVVSATATVSANATATAVASSYPFSSHLILNDVINDNSHGYKWDETTSNGTICQFFQGSYHAGQTAVGYFTSCAAANTDFNNFTYEVKMTIVKGDAGGIIFRADNANSKFYYMRIGQNGAYDFYLYTDSSHSQNLGSGSIPSAVSGYYTGLNQSNVIGIVARGNILDFYANGQRFFHVVDSNNTYAHGEIGVTAEAENNATDVAFSDAKVWQL